VTVSLRDARRSPGDRAWIAGIYRDYLEDLAPESTGLFPLLGEFGQSEPDQLDRWFHDPNALLLVIADSAQPVGFALVSRAVPEPGRAQVDYRMSEFFIARSHRRRGIGRSAVQLIFDRLAGRWEVLEHQRNPDAVKFWRRVVAAYTGGKYQERVSNGEVRQLFESGSRPRPR
jgi:predicted acetyltransferase